MELDYEQKLQALNAIAECSVKMRKPGDWYVCQGVEIKRGGCLVGEYGNGRTPIEAILNHWKTLTEIPSDEYLVIYKSGTRRAFKWIGFMWDVVEEPASK